MASSCLLYSSHIFTYYTLFIFFAIPNPPTPASSNYKVFIFNTVASDSEHFILQIDQTTHAKLVSSSRANLNSGNLGRKSVDEVRNEMKKLIKVKILLKMNGMN